MKDYNMILSFRAPIYVSQVVYVPQDIHEVRIHVKSNLDHDRSPTIPSVVGWHKLHHIFISSPPEYALSTLEHIRV
jgi:hypothetical protein